mmetsp:Transcript_19225/g.48309  ORF Transcript_19225/g.48309 Transcript_19225/m.48309 type:complete len:298 (-) Transcript_19225:327-1220(-)
MALSPLVKPGTLKKSGVASSGTTTTEPKSRGRGGGPAEPPAPTSCAMAFVVWVSMVIPITLLLAQVSLPLTCSTHVDVSWVVNVRDGPAAPELAMDFPGTDERRLCRTECRGSHDDRRRRHHVRLLRSQQRDGLLLWTLHQRWRPLLRSHRVLAVQGGSTVADAPWSLPSPCWIPSCVPGAVARSGRGESILAAECGIQRGPRGCGHCHHEKLARPSSGGHPQVTVPEGIRTPEAGIRSRRRGGPAVGTLQSHFAPPLLDPIHGRLTAHLPSCSVVLVDGRRFDVYFPGGFNDCDRG